MNSRMIEAAETGNINALYELIQEDPCLLEQIDRRPFCGTPLHIAACSEHLPFVMEMLNLKPSFARKLNQDGMSPMHLALANDEIPTVRQLMKFDKSLVRVKGKEGMTPLHYVVQFGKLNILIEFLEVVPEAIEDVTVRDDTAFHIAINYDQIEAFQVLIGWLRRSCHIAADRWEKELLSAPDTKGNTVLHAAVIRNKSQVVKLLLENFCPDHINDKNKEGKTALDIAAGSGESQEDLERQRDERDPWGNEQIKDMLVNACKGLICSSHCKKSNSSTETDSLTLLKSRMSCYETFKTAIARGKRTISDETRNLFLVVTVLIITTTYNASLAPPKVKLSDTVRADRQSEALAIPDYPTPTKNQWFPDSIDAIADVFSMYWLYNSLIFWASVGLTAFLLPSRSSVCFFLHIALSFLGTCYMLLMAATSFDVIYYFQSKSDSNDWYYVNFIMNYLFALFLSLFVAYRIALYVRLKLAMTSRRVYLILIAPLSVVVLAPIIPAVVLAEKLWRRDVKGHV